MALIDSAFHLATPALTGALTSAALTGLLWRAFA